MTLKQKTAAKKLVENQGNIGQAMIAAGYSPASAKNPKNLTESKGFKELLEEYFPDGDLLRVGQEGLQATKLATSFTEADQFIPDYPTRHRYYETALKLKRHLGPDVQVNTLNLGELGVRVVNRNAGS